MTYAAEASRQDRWWMVSIPAIDGLTQARRLSEVSLMAREYIAAATGVPLEEVEVEVTVRSVGEDVVSERLDAIRRDRAEAARLNREASDLTAALARDLVAHAVPLRDVGSILGLSHQRVHQLTSQ